MLYTSGVTGKADYAAAAGLFQKAASHGLGDSQFNLAVLYENGLGVERDDLEAYKWFSLAAASGDKEALARRDEVKKRLSKASVAKAEQAVKSWRPVPADRLANEGAQVGVLGVSLAPGASTAGAAAAGDDVAAVKDMLARLGYDVDTGTSGLDGKTRAAIMRFEGRSGMTPSGEVTPELVERLHALAG
ncbi:MAG: SEL1-like repeat protein [Hyphomicrobiaceae bacterium]